MNKEVYLQVIFILLLVAACQPEMTMGEKYQKITISRPDSLMEFRISDEDISVEDDKEYWWYRGGEIHRQYAGYSGKLLDDSFIVYDREGRLTCEGTFKEGLKHGIWKKWLAGDLVSMIEYKNGVRSGKYERYRDGKVMVSGKFRKGYKDGPFLYQTDSVEIFIKYKKNVAVDTSTVNTKN